MVELRGDEVLQWLNERKRQVVAGERRPISDILFTSPDDASGPGHYWEGREIQNIQFLDSDGNGSVTSTDPDEAKRGAHVLTQYGEVFAWVRGGEEAILETITDERPEDGRILSVQVH